MFYIMFYFSYTIEDLEAEEMLSFSMSLFICFESHGDCRYSYDIFKDTKISKQPCHWNGAFPIPSNYPRIFFLSQTIVIWFICFILSVIYNVKGPLWSWAYGSWIYNYLCIECLSPLKLWVLAYYQPITAYFQKVSL